MKDLEAYVVWDAGVRWFHWINAVCMLGLIAVGVAILNDKALGVTVDGKILLKTVHVWIGYVFMTNLLWRLVWAFIGGPYARWRAILPGGRGYLDEVRAYIAKVLGDASSHRVVRVSGEKELEPLRVQLPKLSPAQHHA